MNYTLPCHTILDGRYRIERVIGEGGFAITYAATNTVTNNKVAIKEFYYHEYVYRDVTVSMEVGFSSPEKQESYEKARARFLRESRIISDFSGDRNIVSILDYFEENATAYIVMEYLEGVTLKDYVMTYGPWDAEKFGLMLIPLLTSLGRIHEAGIIHRDISPDNIILMEDGHLCLIDFGAAGSFFKESQKTTSIISKNGYTPCEQYDSDMKSGPWSDIYALSAVYYYCITGKKPDGSLQRLLLDTLAMPSQLGVKITPQLEKVLSKGLAVSKEDRYQSVYDFVENLQKYLPREDPDAAGKKKMRRWVIGGVLCCILLAFCIFYQTHEEIFIFWNTQTESFILFRDAGEASADLSEEREIIAERVEHLVGSNQYIVDEKDGYLRCVVPKASFADYNILDVLRYVISRRMQPYFDAAPLEQSDIIEPALEEAKDAGTSQDKTYLTFGLSDTYAAIMENDREIKGKSHSLNMDYKSEDNFSSTIEYGEDGRYRIQLPCHGHFAETFLYNLTQGPMENSLYFQYDIEAVWENAEATLLKGENQVNEDSVKEPYVTLEFSTYEDADDISRGQWYHMISDFKTRLDSLNINYSFGTDPNEEKHIMVKLAQQDYYAPIAWMLPEYAYQVSVDISGTDFNLSQFSMNIVNGEDGNYRVDLTYTDYSREKYETAIKQLAADDDPVFYLKNKGVIIAEGKMTDPKDSVLHLTSYGTGGENITTDTLPILQLTQSICYETDPPVFYHLFSRMYKTGTEGIQKEAASRDVLAPNQKNEEALLAEIEQMLPEGGNCFANSDESHCEFYIILPYSFSEQSSGDAYRQLKKYFMTWRSYDCQPPWLIIQQKSAKDENSLTGKISWHGENLNNIYQYYNCFDERCSDFYAELYQLLSEDEDMKQYLHQ